jgi:hypothetical protein
MSADLKVCFNGCSFTAGEGFPYNQRDQYIYDRILSTKFNFRSTNLAVKGSDNHGIFMRSADAIQSKKYDIVFTQWSALNRIWLSPGPEIYYFVNDEKYPDFTYRDLYISPNEKINLNNKLLLLNHDYQNIMDLIDYCKILNQLSKINSTKIFFINGLVPWQDDLINPINVDNLSQVFSTYTKQILDFDTRNDAEIIDYFTKLQKKFIELDQTNWINLFSSFLSNAVDISPEGLHPGIKSHRWMADQVSNFLMANNIL